MMFPTISFTRAWDSVFLCAAVALFFGVALGLMGAPAAAHDCSRHSDTNHKHCNGGGGGTEPPPAPFNPEIVWSTLDRDVVVANGDGSNAVTILSGVRGGRIRSVSWSPDGTEILFATDASGQDPAGVYRLPIFDGNGQFSVGTPTLVVTTSEQFGRARWSPGAAPDDNFWIAYTDVSPDGQTDVFLINPADGTKVPLTNNTEIEVGLTWSPDSTRIAVLSIRDGSGVPEDIEIYSLSKDGGENLVVGPPVSLLLDNWAITDLTSNAAILADNSITNLIDLDWANTDDRIAVGTFARQLNEADTSYRIWILPVPEGNPQQAVADGTVLAMDEDSEVPRFWPSWSPDDTKLIYRRGGKGGICEVPSAKAKGPRKVSVNLVIGVLTPSGELGEGPLEIKCEDENVLNADGIHPEWWRGGDGFTPPSP